VLEFEGRSFERTKTDEESDFQRKNTMNLDVNCFEFCYQKR
jgi:hypothetical protein